MTDPYDGVLVMQTVEGMKLICYELMDAANRHLNDDLLRVYDSSANELVIELTKKVEQVRTIPCYVANCLSNCTRALFMGTIELAFFLTGL
jgi:hypothetical protein